MIDIRITSDLLRRRKN